MRNGDPLDVVEVQDVGAPDLAPGHLRVAVSAASINFGDIARCRGGVASVMAQPPFTLGMDVCGVVESASEGSERWLGRRVVSTTAQSFGGMAELALCTPQGTFDAPPELDDVEAAAFLLPFHTTYLGMHRRARLQPGETLLVVGGASALGTAAIQLGVAAGAHVVAVAGGGEKGDVCTGLGAELAIDHGTDIFDAVMDYTDGRGADVALDMVGGAGTEGIWTCMAQGGRYVPVGFNDDPDSGMTGRPLRKVSMGNFSIMGVLMGYNEASLPMRRFGINTFPRSVGDEVHAALCELVAAGSIRPYIGRRIGMDGAAAALDDHDKRRTIGRTVIDVAGKA